MGNNKGTVKAIGNSCQPSKLETRSNENNSSEWARDASARVPQPHGSIRRVEAMTGVSVALCVYMCMCVHVVN